MSMWLTVGNSNLQSFADVPASKCLTTARRVCYSQVRVFPQQHGPCKYCVCDINERSDRARCGMKVADVLTPLSEGP